MKKFISLVLATVMLASLVLVMAPFVFAEDAPEAQKVGSAEDLKGVIAKINADPSLVNTNITLTHDIDLAEVTGWKPLKNYSGTFDGAGFTIKNLTHSVTIENNDANKLDGGTNVKEYVIADYKADGSEITSECFGQVGISLLVTKAEGATFKNFTVQNCSLTSTFNYNKNWQPFYGALVAYMNNGVIEDVHFENVDVTVDETSGTNMGLLGFAGLMVGATDYTVTVEGCTIDGESTLDASHNAKYENGAFVGRHSATDPIYFINCTTAAAVTAPADINNSNGMMPNAGTTRGGHAAAFVGYFLGANNAKADLFYCCSNTGELTPAQQCPSVSPFVGRTNGTRNIRTYNANEAVAKTLLSGNESKNGVQFQRVDDGSVNARVIIEGKNDALVTYDSAAFAVEFAMNDGTVRSYISENQVVAYTKVSAAGEIITATDGCSLMGLVVTGIDYDAIRSISVTVILTKGEEQTVVPVGTARLSADYFTGAAD